VRQVDQLRCDLVPYNYAEVSKSGSILLLSDEEEVEHVKQMTTITRAFTPTCLPYNIWKDDYALRLEGRDIVIVLRKNDTSSDFFASRPYPVAKSVRVVKLDYRNADSPLVRNPGVREFIQTVTSADKVTDIINNTAKGLSSTFFRSNAYTALLYALANNLYRSMC